MDFLLMEKLINISHGRFKYLHNYACVKSISRGGFNTKRVTVIPIISSLRKSDPLAQVLRFQGRKIIGEKLNNTPLIDFVLQTNYGDILWSLKNRTF